MEAVSVRGGDGGMRARKVDRNLGEIVDAARRVGFLVYIRNDVLGDLDVQLAKVHEVWECKTPKGKFTQTQQKYREAGWVIRTIRSVEDVINARRELAK